MSAAGKPPGRAHVLVVEDSSVFREMQDLLLRQAGYVVSSHENPRVALEAAAKQQFELVVIDYELPDMNGEQFMHALRKMQPNIEVIFVSGALTEELVIRLGTQRVSGIFHKPTNPKTLLEKIDETLARNAARDTAARIGSGSPLAPTRRGGSNSPVAVPAIEASADRLAYAPRFLLGRSDTFRDFTHRLWKVRDFRAVLLLQGEAGSPFDLLARELAEISIFRDGPIMVCEAARFDAHTLIQVLAPCLLSHDAGTLLVTGVETLTSEQQKVLENLMTGRDVFLPFARRFRLVLAATSELSERVDEGAFGETLYYKASSLTLAVPPLRTMCGDVAANAEHLLTMYRAAGHGDAPARIAPDLADWLNTQEWPGNYDQLARTILKSATFAHGAELTIADVTQAVESAEEGETLAMAIPQLVAAGVADQSPGEARPPFPIASTIAADAGAPGVRPAAPVPIGQSPAGKLFARATGPAPVLTTPSLFRPPSNQYSFATRLAASLAMPTPSPAH